MKSFVLLVALFVGYISCYTEKEYQDAFTKWMQEQQRSYTAVEFGSKYAAFKGNMDYVDVCNANPAHTFKCGLNTFSDLTNAEFRKIYTMDKIVDTRPKNVNPWVGLNKINETHFVGDDVVNWAAKGAVVGVKNQGQCGSCWAFSVASVTESLNQMYTGNLNSLSEQNLMDCSQSYGTNGCNGGDPAAAYKYIIANNGIELEANYPYQAAMGSCNFQSQYTGASFKSYEMVNQGDENDLQNHINSQPVSVCVDGGANSFQSYSSGIYNAGDCDSNTLDHAVVAIGYGSDNGDYYIIRNSWGTGWGLSGYMWMARNDNNFCGIANYASVPRP